MPETVVPVVTDWGQAIFLALTRAVNQILGFVPVLIGALVILFVGWIISRVVEGLVVRGLRLVRFNQVADRAEIDRFLAQAGVRMDPAAVIGKLIYWFLMLIFIGAAFNSFGLTQVNDIINRIVAYIPNVIVAVVVLLLGALVANFVANLVRGATGTAHLGDPRVMATLARAAILLFAGLIALDQLEIAPAIINTLWMAVAGMIALAGALAFGLGGRDVARQIVEDWYRRASDAGHSEQMAGTARFQGQRETYTTAVPPSDVSAEPPPSTGPVTHRPAA
ncbi:MAG TPA: small-conductance mechanosensitive ion channel [Chloroflexota bacterium]|jgi:hypothetical protein|nr:small-conductance mechanosensitive ion channel [Chloroflexota bacterium]